MDDGGVVRNMNDETRESLSAVVPAVQAPHSVTCLRSLKRRGVHTIAAYEEPTPAFCSRHCDETHVVTSPDTDVEGYKDELLALASRDDVRAIFPMREVDVYVLSKYRSEFSATVAPLWPSFETLEVAHDRYELVEAARNAGVPTPETRLLDEVPEWDAKRIIKARYALLTEEYLCDDLEGGTAEPPDVRYLPPGIEPNREEIRAEMKHAPLVQEYVPGDEYAFWALYEDGEPIATCQKRQLRALRYAGGTSVYRETVKIPELASAGHDLLEHLDWNGFASVQFKKDDRTGEFKLLELNPRVWVSVSCPVTAGLDFPYYYWQRSNGNPTDPTPDYEQDVATHRIGGELMYLLSILRTDNPFVEKPPFYSAVREVVSSLYRRPHFDYFRLDDPYPFFCDIKKYVHDT